MPDAASLLTTRTFSAQSATLRTLAKRTETVSQAIPPQTKIGYIDYPMHINVGDLLIFLGTMDFFSWNGNRIVSSFCTYGTCPRSIRSLDDVDVIACHGGGNFGDIYPLHQHLRERVIKAFPKKPIVILPQTLHFRSQSAMRDSAATFRQHPNVTIYVRDEPSHGIARQYFSDQVYFSPDMAHRLYDSFAPIRTAPVDEVPGPLCLMRRDVEAAGDHILAGPDWRDILRFSEKVRIERHRISSKISGRTNRCRPEAVFAYQRTVRSVITALARRLLYKRAWITSRLHGAIFGLLLDRDLELIENSYGKNSRYFEKWGPSLVSLRASPAETAGLQSAHTGRSADDQPHHAARRR